MIMTFHTDTEVRRLLDELDKLPRHNVMRFYPYQVLFRYWQNNGDSPGTFEVNMACDATRHLLDYLGES